PTAVPTVEPTAAPTNEPTTVPPNVPTNEPTAVPTAVPTNEATVAPTDEPNPAPMETPTAAPSVEPTLEPTVEATAMPTGEPTATPVPELPTPDAKQVVRIMQVQVMQSEDDAEEDASQGSVSIRSDDLELSENRDRPQVVGVRFQNVALPPAARVVNAYIAFQTDSAG
ncbi:MAG: hypothetical protein KDE54_21200, partial [Caldilineaceae bacterium]|nr:hypothetical protein [Caldilineaceae bacterium]